MPKLTPAQAVKAVEWFQDWMGLEDWKITIEIGNAPPDWTNAQERKASLGLCFWDESRKESGVWVNPASHKGETGSDSDMLATMFHELCHILAADMEISTDATKQRLEFMFNRLGALMAQSYRARVRVRK